MMTSVIEQSARPLMSHWQMLGPLRNALNNLWKADWDHISHVELIPGIPIISDELTIPKEWASAGMAQTKAERTVSFVRMLPDTWTRDEQKSEAAIRRLKRVAALMLLRTLRVGKRSMSPPKPTTWVAIVQTLLRMTSRVLGADNNRDGGDPQTSRCSDGPPIFASLDRETLEALIADDNNFSRNVAPRLTALYRANEFDDWLDVDVARGRCRSEPWQPFNDDFVGQLGHAALWIMETLGPDLISCYSQLLTIGQTPEGRRRNGDVQRYRKEWVRA